MIGANYCRESIVTTDDRESSEDDDESIIDRCQPPTRSCENFGNIVDGSFLRRKKRSVIGIRDSKKSVRRSAALIVKNSPTFSRTRNEASRHKFACCDRCVSANSKSRGRQRRSRINVRQSGGSISRGCVTGTRALHETTSSTSFLAYSCRREKNDSRNRQTGRNTMRKFPPLVKVSSVTEEDEKNIRSRNCCHCYPADQRTACENSKATFFSQSKPGIIRQSIIPCGVYRKSSNHHRVFTIENSSSEDRDVDYQVPLEYSRSCESGTTRTLVPTSSHITVRICPVDSKSSKTCGCRNEDDSPRSLNSQTSLNHFEDRVRRGLRAMCCCRSDSSKTGFLDPRNGLKKLSESEPESRVSKSLPRMQSGRRCGPESGEKKVHRRCCCNKCKTRLSNSSEKPDGLDNSIKWNRKYFKEAYGSLSNSEKDVASFQSRLREQRMPKNRPNEERSRCGTASETTTWENPRGEKNAWKMMRNRRPPPMLMNKNDHRIGFLRGKIADPTIVLSAPEYRDFLNRCERIRESIRSMMRDEGTKKCSDISKGGSKPCATAYDDLRPNLPPMNHWSQYGDRMRDVANEYKRLRLYLDKVNSRRENQVPSCPSRRSSLTSSRMQERCEKKEVISAQEMQKNGQRCCLGCSKHGNEKFLGDVDGGRERSVWFDKIKEGKKSCCNECDKDVNKIKESCATMRAREAELVRTLETFCEKIKRVKSEFDKPLATSTATTGCFPCGKKSSEVTSNVRCRSCCGRRKNGLKNRGKFKAKKLLIFPPEGEDGPPLTLFKNSSSVNCRVKGDSKTGFRYNVTYVQRFVSSSWHPSAKEDDKSSIDSG